MNPLCPSSQGRVKSKEPSKMFPRFGARYGSRIGQATWDGWKIKNLACLFQDTFWASPNDQILLGYPFADATNQTLRHFQICWMTITETRLSAIGCNNRPVNWSARLQTILKRTEKLAKQEAELAATDNAEEFRQKKENCWQLSSIRYQTTKTRLF